MFKEVLGSLGKRWWLGVGLAVFLVSSVLVLGLSAWRNQSGRPTADLIQPIASYPPIATLPTSPTVPNPASPSHSALAPSPNTAVSSPKTTPASTSPTSLPAADCPTTHAITLTAAPISLDDLEMIGPMGIMAGAHVVPSDHLGFAPKQGSQPEHNVIVPADGTIQSVQTRTKSVETGATMKTEYHIVIQHTCSLSTRYDLINHLSPALAASLGTNHLSQLNLKVKAGDSLGTLDDDGHGLDFWTVDQSITHTGTVNPSRIVREPWRIHVIDPFPLFAEPLQSQLRAKAMRTAPPQGGKIDYDIDGRLVGDWYRPGTNDGSPNFWTNQLSFAFDPFDPATPVISIGDWDGQSKQFVFKTGSPPEAVNPTSGLVKYEVYTFNRSHADGRTWDFTKFANDLIARPAGPTQGTLLVQLTSNQTLQLETFPGQSAQTVTGFTASARTYER